jgi:hypothetical protein
MTFKELFEAEKTKKTNSIFDRYKKSIQKASPRGISKEAINYYKAKFLKEKSRLFQQKTNLNAKYHWIENYYRVYLSLDGAAYTFDEKIKYIKKIVLAKYKGHEYLSSLVRFFDQEDKVIIIKLAHHAAYEEIARLFDDKNDKELRKKLRKKAPTSLSNPVKQDTNVEFRNLFRGENEFYKAELVIKNNLLNDDGEWSGHTGELQEITILVSYLKKHFYIDYVSRTKAVTIFCNKFKIHLSDRTKRTAGLREKEIFKYFQEIFPVL